MINLKPMPKIENLADSSSFESMSTKLQELNNFINVSSENIKTIMDEKSLAYEPTDKFTTLVQKLNNKPTKSILYGGEQFNNTLLQMNGFENITEIRFVKEVPNSSGINVATQGDAAAYIQGNILTIASKGEIFANSNCKKMFYGFGHSTNKNKKLSKITFDNFNTSQVTDMSYMFGNCGSLTSLDVSTFDTNQVTDMSYMFSVCGSLIGINISGINTTNVVHMRGMFYSCSVLKNLTLTNLTFKNTKYTSYMFAYCYALTSRVVIDSLSIIDYNSMFTNCSTNYNTEFIVDFSNSDTRELAKRIVETKGNSSSNVKLYVPRCRLIASSEFSSRVSYMSGFTSVRQIVFDGEIPSNISNYSNEDLSYDSDSSIMGYIDGSTLRVVSNGTIYLKSCYNLFNGLSNITSFTLTNFDTSEVTDMDSMFKRCSSLSSIGLRGLNTSRVRDMRSMFYECTSLRSVDVTGVDTGSVRYMGSMFYKCESLTSLNLSSFDTSQVTDMSYMFYLCTRLTTIDVSNFNTSQVTDLSGMFAGYDNSETGRMNITRIIGIENFDTSKVTNMYAVFAQCFYLSNANLSRWNLNNVTSTELMFYNCLTLNGRITIRNTNITNYNLMFGWCSINAGVFYIDYTSSARNLAINMMNQTGTSGCSVYLGNQVG